MNNEKKPHEFSFFPRRQNRDFHSCGLRKSDDLGKLRELPTQKTRRDSKVDDPLVSYILRLLPYAGHPPFPHSKIPTGTPTWPTLAFLCLPSPALPCAVAPLLSS